MKILYYFLILMFLAFAAVQCNDPDPAIWIPLYLIPCFLVFRKMNNYKTDKLYFFIIGLLYLLWAANQFPPAWEGVTLNEVGMKTINIELGRESLGLALTGIIIWILPYFK